MEAAWAIGGDIFLGGSFKDISTDRRANDTMAEFIRSKIRETVKDPETAEKLLPTDHPFGGKRALIDTNYFDTYNRENVRAGRYSPLTNPRDHVERAYGLRTKSTNLT